MIEIKNKFCFQMLDGILDAFDRLIQHFVKHFIVGMCITLQKLDILLSERNFQSSSVVCILNQQCVFVGCSTSIFNHSKHVAAQANDDNGLC